MKPNKRNCLFSPLRTAWYRNTAAMSACVRWRWTNVDTGGVPDPTYRYVWPDALCSAAGGKGMGNKHPG